MLGINTNVTSLTAQRNLSGTTNGMQTTLQRLSSGLRINSAKDDAAGLAISERMTSQIRGLDQARRNANDGISLAQTAEGALVEIGNNMQRMRELAIQAANDTNTAGDRATIQKEMLQLKNEIDRVAQTTEFNGQKLLDGSFTDKKFQVGANADQTISMTTNNAQTTALGAARLTATGTMNVAKAGTDLTGLTNGVDATEALTVSGSLGAATLPAPAAGATGKALAAAVNAETSKTGVSAEAVTKAQLSKLSAGGNISFALNGQAITANVGSASDLTSLADAINNFSSATGVTAALDPNNKGTLTLTSATGDNISILNFASDTTGGQTIQFAGVDAFTGDLTTSQTLTEGGTNNDSALVGATLRFSSQDAFTVTSAAAGGVFNLATPNASGLAKVSSIDVGTQPGANDAIGILDGALASINSQRAMLGAVQNRFSSTIANLQTTSENLSASRSRIKDADFAQETANLSRNQVLQQAGTAMLAQANQGPQIALQLLR